MMRGYADAIRQCALAALTIHLPLLPCACSGSENLFCDFYKVHRPRCRLNVTSSFTLKYKNYTNEILIIHAYLYLLHTTYYLLLKLMWLMTFNKFITQQIIGSHYINGIWQRQKINGSFIKYYAIIIHLIQNHHSVKSKYITVKYQGQNNNYVWSISLFIIRIVLD